MYKSTVMRRDKGGTTTVRNRVSHAFVKSNRDEEETKYKPTGMRGNKGGLMTVKNRITRAFVKSLRSQTLSENNNGREERQT